MPTPPVQIDNHQPERRRRAVTTMYCGGGCCCCCCCCCLHTLGSIVGAAVAPTIGRGAPTAMTYYYDDETGEAIPNVSKPRRLSAVTVFWWVSCLLIFLGFLIPVLTNPSDSSGMMITGVIILLVFPAIQIASVVITLIAFAVWRRPDKSHQTWQLVKIMLGTLLGALLGVLAMGVLFGGFAVIMKLNG